MHKDKEFFHKRKTVEQVEEDKELAPKFDKDGLIVCVTTSSKNGDVLMVGYMNQEALIKTIETGEAHYFSRSRNCLWHKGATSGLIQKVKDIRIDDDQDAVWISVEMEGDEASCHVGYRSCFYRSIPIGQTPDKNLKLVFKEDNKVFDPVEVYGADAENPTKL
ncbi:MAG: phosphoribosyl-AMP cyclohydrolase [Rickettsiales bacterium]|jgi:phosphoribosyl-AMP cyclohydrolase|nr:phosphoribosyl-AMP cyclohydrolase [Rickettsiales bacterium]